MAKILEKICEPDLESLPQQIKELSDTDEDNVIIATFINEHLINDLNSKSGPKKTLFMLTDKADGSGNVLSLVFIKLKDEKHLNWRYWLRQKSFNVKAMDDC